MTRTRLRKLICSIFLTSITFDKHVFQAGACEGKLGVVEYLDLLAEQLTLTLTLPSEAMWPPQRAAFWQASLSPLLDNPSIVDHINFL